MQRMLVIPTQHPAMTLQVGNLQDVKPELQVANLQHFKPRRCQAVVKMMMLVMPMQHATRTLEVGNLQHFKSRCCQANANDAGYAHAAPCSGNLQLDAAQAIVREAGGGLRHLAGLGAQAVPEEASPETGGRGLPQVFQEMGGTRDARFEQHIQQSMDFLGGTLGTQ